MSSIQLTVHLDRSDRTYLEGEHLTGWLRVTVTDEVDCTELVVELAHQFSGRRGRGDGVEAASQLFKGRWAPGTYDYPFRLPVASELPSYQGHLFTITRMVRARLTPAHGAPVAQVAMVWIAARPRDDDWFDPREQQPPPVLFVVNDQTVRLIGLKRAAEAAVGLVTGRRGPASVEVRPRVLVGGGTAVVTVTVRGAAGRLGGLRARLRGEESWPRDKGPVTHIVHTKDFAPSTSVEAGVTTLRFEVPLPQEALSIESLLQWRIQLRGAYGCLDNRDRWQPLWVGPSEASLRLLRGRSPQELTQDTDGTEQALRAASGPGRSWRTTLQLTALHAAWLIPVLVSVLSQSRSTGLMFFAGAAVLATAITLAVRRKRALDRAFQDRQYLGRSLAPDPIPEFAPAAGEALGVPPPISPVRVEVIRIGESPANPRTVEMLRRETISTQRRMTRRGVVGLLLMLAVNLAASVVEQTASMPLGLAATLTVLSVFALLASTVVSPNGRPLSCYVGMAPLLVVAWMLVSAGRAVVAATLGARQASASDLAASLILLLGIVSVVLLTRGYGPSPNRGRRLLVLWVFGATSRMEEIMRDVALQWMYLGPIQYLRGPGSRVDLGRLAAAVRGRTRELFADTLPEVMAHLRRFRFTPNRFGIYSLNSIQCTDAVWRDAVDTLLDSTDLVMMDLTTLGEKNQGCAYELGVLIARLPASRCVLVVDGTTDINLLTALLERLWGSMPLTSPNRQEDSGPIRLLRIPLRGAVTHRRRWAEAPMNDLVHLLFEPVAAGTGS